VNGAHSSGRRAWAGFLIVAILAIFAATLLPPDCDGLPGFDDEDGNGDAVCLWTRHAVAAPPSGIATPEPPRLLALAEPGAAAAPFADTPRAARPSRSPPCS
jgi:hypothetical protein